jgi:CheY-like chemotaxis protein
VRQILLNLLSNAVKYTESGWIRLAARAVRVVTAGGGAGDGGDGALGEAELQFDVEDSGVGIRPEDMGRLFGEFTRLDGKRNSGVEGTGLGLAIARSLARAMGGDIEAESAYGEGSTFRVTMRQAVCDWAPMGRLADEHEGEPEPQPVSFTAPGAELLVVDDYRTNLIVAEGLLAPYGMRLTFAAGGAEAVRLASERRFDLIFMDHMMPGMDGVEACGEIRSLPEGGSVPVVAMTANAVVGMREMYLASGFSDFLSKPIDTFSLDACLSRWIPLYLRGPAPGRAGPAGGGRGAAGDRSGQAERRSLPDRRQDSVEGEDPDRREGMDRRLGADRRAWKDGSHQAALAAAGAGPAEDPLSIDGVDTVAGEHRAGGRERYLSYLEAFRGDAGRTAEAIAAIPDAGGLRDFTKAVHGLKGGLAAIGARPLYYWAAALEAAGRAGDLGLVVVGLPPFRERLGQLLARIDQIVPQAPREDVELAGRIAGLREAIRRRDIQDADRMILLVRESCGRELAPALDSIVDDILANDYDKALEDASALAAAGHSRA